MNKRDAKLIVDFIRKCFDMFGTYVPCETLGDEFIAAADDEAFETMSIPEEPKPVDRDIREAVRMGLAVREKCRLNHVFYRDAKAPAHCPFCLYRSLTSVNTEMKRIKATLRMLSA